VQMSFSPTLPFLQLKHSLLSGFELCCGAFFIFK
jgi:hypothetical protein